VKSSKRGLNVGYLLKSIFSETVKKSGFWVVFVGADVVEKTTSEMIQISDCVHHNFKFRKEGGIEFGDIKRPTVQYLPMYDRQRRAALIFTLAIRPMPIVGSIRFLNYLEFARRLRSQRSLSIFNGCRQSSGRPVI